MDRSRQHRQVVRGQQKKLQDSRKWRYVEVECKRDEQSTWKTPCHRKWNSFLRQTDLGRRKVAVEGLIYALQHEPLPKFGWLEGEEVTAEERLIELRRWIAAQLRPVMAPSSILLPPAPGGPVEPLEAHTSNDDEDEENHPERYSDDEDDEDDEDDSENSDDADERNRKRKGKSKGEDLELGVQVAALRLVSALALLCTSAHVHLLLGCSATPSGATVVPSNPKGKPKGGRVVPGVLEVLHRVLTCVPSDASNAMKRTRLRVEAMHALAVVCFVREDPAVALETCETLARHYLCDIRPLAADSSDDDGEDDGDDDSDGEAIDDDDDGNDGEEGDDDEFTIGDNLDQQALLVGCGKSEAEYAAALGTMAFLLSLVDSDDDVRAFIGNYKEALISLFLAHRRGSADIAGSCRVRMNAATLLGVLYRLSRVANHDDSDEGEDEDDGEEEEEEEEEVDEREMSVEGKRRFVELCEVRARRRGSGRRTRGGLERKWARREAGFFRALAAELRADDYRRLLHQAADADARDEAARCNERVRRERHVSRLETDLHSNEPHSFKIEGWRWDLTLGFLRKYCHQHFEHLFGGRPEFRRATKQFPVETLVHRPWGCPQFSVRKVNRDTLKGRSTQTKRFRKEAERNWTRANHENYRGSSEYSSYYRGQQAEQRRGRAVEREWRLANERGLW